MQFLKIQMFDSKIRNFFTEIVHSNIKYREENNVKINDVINLLMQARRDGAIEIENEKAYESAGFATVLESDEIKRSSAKVASRWRNFPCYKLKIYVFLFIAEWDEQDIVAQCLIFFLAGFDTVSTAIYFMAYALSIYPNVQQKLQQEVEALVTKLNGRLPTYEEIQNLSYLDMVLSETLRMFPPVPFLDRRCNQKTTIENSDGTKVELQPGDGIFFPVSSIHHDEKYFPEPEKFIPERFSHENRDNIKPFSYFPFGVGPRNCIGSRFALMETKALFFSILSNFTIEKCNKTEIPLQIKPDVFQNRPKNGVWVALTPKKRKIWN